jgi:hypothetical protein
MATAMTHGELLCMLASIMSWLKVMADEAFLMGVESDKGTTQTFMRLGGEVTFWNTPRP